MKESYSHPTVYNASNMKLSTTSRGRNSLVLEKAVAGAILPAIALSASMVLLVGRKDIGEKAIGLPK